MNIAKQAVFSGLCLLDRELSAEGLEVDWDEMTVVCNPVEEAE